MDVRQQNSSSLFWGSAQYRRNYSGFGGTLKAGLAGWLTVLCVAVPCLIFNVPFFAKLALCQEGEWSGVGTALLGMALLMVVIGPLLFIGTFAAGVLR